MPTMQPGRYDTKNARIAVITGFSIVEVTKSDGSRVKERVWAGTLAAVAGTPEGNQTWSDDGSYIPAPPQKRGGGHIYDLTRLIEATGPIPGQEVDPKDAKIAELEATVQSLSPDWSLLSDPSIAQHIQTLADETYEALGVAAGGLGIEFVNIPLDMHPTANLGDDFKLLIARALIPLIQAYQELPKAAPAAKAPKASKS